MQWPSGEWGGGRSMGSSEKILTPTQRTQAPSAAQTSPRGLDWPSCSPSAPLRRESEDTAVGVGASHTASTTGPDQKRGQQTITEHARQASMALIASWAFTH